MKERINIVKDILAALEREKIDMGGAPGIRTLVKKYKKYIEETGYLLDIMSFRYFLTRILTWLKEAYGLSLVVHTTDTGAFTYDLTGYKPKRLHRSATRERAIAAGIIRGIEMIGENETQR